MIIAIDGPAASGKGTLAKRVAVHYGLPHLDTGLLYRAVGRDALARGIALDNAEATAEVASTLEIATLDDPALRTAGAGEAASQVARHPAVLESGVVGVPSAKWGEEVKACVVLRPGQKADADQIIAHCRTLLAGFKCPKSVDFLDALPRNANGKILKRVLREPYWPEAGRQVG